MAAVMLGHQVVVHTLDFVPQSGHMSLEDMQATWHCTRELEGIAFFNSGEDSGARCVWLCVCVAVCVCGRVLDLTPCMSRCVPQPTPSPHAGHPD